MTFLEGNTKRNCWGGVAEAEDLPNPPSEATHNYEQQSCSLVRYPAHRHMRRRTMATEVFDIVMRLVAAGFLGGCIGFERRIHHKAIGIAGMVLIAIGSTTYMLLGRHLAALDPSSISRTLQGFLSRIGFLGGAVIFKSGFDVKGIKAAAAIWITGALGLAIATSYWWLGITVGLVTAAVMYVANSFPDEVREEKQETPNPHSDAKK
jgi:putative Mg2+ transporter-C (MgtC) family protein